MVSETRRLIGHKEVLCKVLEVSIDHLLLTLALPINDWNRFFNDNATAKWEIQARLSNLFP